MSLLDRPDAQTLLKDAILTPEAVRGCRDRLRRFLSRYLRRSLLELHFLTPPDQIATVLLWM